MWYVQTYLCTDRSEGGAAGEGEDCCINCTCTHVQNSGYLIKTDELKYLRWTRKIQLLL